MWLGSLQDILNGVETAAAGAVTLSVESADLVAFDHYLDAKTPDANSPWFSEFYQVSSRCSCLSTIFSEFAVRAASCQFFVSRVQPHDIRV